MPCRAAFCCTFSLPDILMLPLYYEFSSVIMIWNRFVLLFHHLHLSLTNAISCGIDIKLQEGTNIVRFTRKKRVLSRTAAGWEWSAARSRQRISLEGIFMRTFGFDRNSVFSLNGGRVLYRCMRHTLKCMAHHRSDHSAVITHHPGNHFQVIRLRTLFSNIIFPEASFYLHI